MASRVQVSQRAVAKIIQVFDHLLQRNEKVAKALRGEKEGKDESEIEVCTRLHYNVFYHFSARVLQKLTAKLERGILTVQLCLWMSLSRS